MDRRPHSIRKIAEREVYRNQFVTIFDDEVTLGDSTPGHHVRIVSGDGRPGVAVLAMSGDEVALVRTYRYPLGRWDWGIPRGFGHSPDPVVSAQAELVEELGAEPDELFPLAKITPDSGLLASTVELFLARYAAPIAAPTDTQEIAEVRWVGLADLFSLIAAGSLTDGYTVSAVGAAVARGLIVWPGR